MKINNPDPDALGESGEADRSRAWAANHQEGLPIGVTTGLTRVHRWAHTVHGFYTASTSARTLA
jgi:hypothetical protein